MVAQMHSFKILYVVTKTYLKTHTIYTVNFILFMISYPVRVVGMYYIWLQVLGDTASKTILPYYAIVLMLNGLLPFRALIRLIGDMVTKGDVVLVLTRPFVLWQLLLGRSLARGVGTLLLGVPVIGVVFILSGVGAGLLIWLKFIIVALLGFMMQFLFFYGIGLTAFWTDRTWGQTLLGDWLVQVFGGGLVPLFVLPNWTQDILSRLPFAAMLYEPATILLFPEGTNAFLTLVGKQAAWLAVMIVLVNILWRRGIKRYQGYGL